MSRWFAIRASPPLRIPCCVVEGPCGYLWYIFDPVIEVNLDCVAYGSSPSGSMISCIWELPLEVAAHTVPEVCELRVGERFGENVIPVLIARTPLDDDSSASYVLAHFECVAIDVCGHGSVPAWIGHYLSSE